MVDIQAGHCELNNIGGHLHGPLRFPVFRDINDIAMYIFWLSICIIDQDNTDIDPEQVTFFIKNLLFK